VLAGRGGRVQACRLHTDGTGQTSVPWALPGACCRCGWICGCGFHQVRREAYDCKLMKETCVQYHVEGSSDIQENRACYPPHVDGTADSCNKAASYNSVPNFGSNRTARQAAYRTCWLLLELQWQGFIEELVNSVEDTDASERRLYGVISRLLRERVLVVRGCIACGRQRWGPSWERLSRALVHNSRSC
jgi:hypothetical protein